MTKPDLEVALIEEIARVLSDRCHPTRLAYDRTREAYPDGGEEARAAYYRFLEEERSKKPSSTSPFAAPVSTPFVVTPEQLVNDQTYETYVPTSADGHIIGEQLAKRLDWAPNTETEILHELIEGLGPHLPRYTPTTAQGIVAAVADIALRLDAHEDASTPAFDEIAALCGCPDWEYPGQVIRDVMGVVKERDELREKLRIAEAVRDDARAASARDLEQRRVAEAPSLLVKERDDLRIQLREALRILECSSDELRSSLSRSVPTICPTTNKKVLDCKYCQGDACRYHTGMCNCDDSQRHLDVCKAFMRPRGSGFPPESYPTCELQMGHAGNHSSAYPTERYSFPDDDGKPGSGQPGPHETQQGADTPGHHAGEAAGNVADPNRAPIGHRGAGLSSSDYSTKSSQEIRDEIIAEVGMMASARTPEMQARYDAAVARERCPTCGQHPSAPVSNYPCPDCGK